MFNATETAVAVKIRVLRGNDFTLCRPRVRGMRHPQVVAKGRVLSDGQRSSSTKAQPASAALICSSVDGSSMVVRSPASRPSAMA